MFLIRLFVISLFLHYIDNVYSTSKISKIWKRGKGWTEKDLNKIYFKIWEFFFFLCQNNHILDVLMHWIWFLVLQQVLSVLKVFFISQSYTKNKFFWDFSRLYHFWLSIVLNLLLFVPKRSELVISGFIRIRIYIFDEVTSSCWHYYTSLTWKKLYIKAHLIT